MFAKFRLTSSTLTYYLNWITRDYQLNTDNWTYDVEKKRQEFYQDLLNTVWCDKEKGILDGGKLKDYIFPSNDRYDVFISYSHDDESLAMRLAYYLQEYCGLDVFLDCFIWNSADALLKAIDDDYCQTADKKHNNYRSRNYSTSHVHALLSMAILDVINKSECCIVLDSNNSINLHCLEDPDNAKTLSPWIYEEISFMRHLPQQSTRKTKYFSQGGALESLNESKNLKIANPADFSRFEEMTCEDLYHLNTDGEDNLDKLYERHSI